jgi:hypothetical protein
MAERIAPNMFVDTDQLVTSPRTQAAQNHSTFNGR